MEYINKNILVTGGTGMIGIPLVKKLIEMGAFVYVASLDTDKKRRVEGASYYSPEKADITDINNCHNMCKDIDYVYHIAGIKGSPRTSKEKPASYFVPMMMFNTNMMEAARRAGVKRYMFTSSVGVYSPSPDGIFHEDDVWKTLPSVNGWYPGWAKRMGELQADVYRIQYPAFGNGVRINRPANVYGPFDNFNPENAMVIPSLIARAESGENPLVVWGNGTPARDFIYAEDVADGIISLMESDCLKPVNLGSGTGVSIKEIAETISNIYGIKIEWDASKPNGDPIRLMDTNRAQSLNIRALTSLEEGIMKTVNWYKKFGKEKDDRYNSFETDKLSR